MDCKSAKSATESFFGTSLDTKETTVHSNREAAYRDFCIAGIRADIDHNFLVYKLIDNSDLTNYADKYNNCRVSAYVMRHKISGDLKVIGHSCRLRWCPLCAKSKYFSIAENVKIWLKAVKKPKFITLTLKHNDDPLTVQIDRLYKYFRNLRKSKFIKKNIQGGIWFFQVKKSKATGQWHPHIHIVCDSNFMKQSKLSDLWLKITGDSPICDIKQIRNPDEAAKYVARYVSIPCRLKDFSVSESIDIVHTFFGRRLCGSWGTGRTCSLKIQKPCGSEEWELIAHFNLIWNSPKADNWLNEIKKCLITNQPLKDRPPPDLFQSVKKPEIKKPVFEQIHMSWNF